MNMTDAGMQMDESEDKSWPLAGIRPCVRTDGQQQTKRAVDRADGAWFSGCGSNSRDETAKMPP
jgi:hypothetical protein